MIATRVAAIVVCAALFCLGTVHARADFRAGPAILAASEAPASPPPDVQVQIIPRRQRSASNETASLPVPDTSIPGGSSYFLEVWISDVNNAGQTYTGLTGAYINISYTPAWTHATKLSWSTVFDDLFKEGRIDDPAGQIVNLGGSTIAPHGAEPMWARLAWVDMAAAAAGVPQAIDLRCEMGIGGMGGWNRVIDAGGIEFIAHDYTITPEPASGLLAAVALTGVRIRRRTVRREQPGP